MNEKTIMFAVMILCILVLIGTTASLISVMRKFRLAFKDAQDESFLDEVKNLIKNKQYHTSRIIAFFGNDQGIARQVDGGYVAGWFLHVGNTRQMSHAEQDDHYSGLAQILGKLDKKGIVYQIRGVTQKDLGDNLVEWQKINAPVEIVNREARIHALKSMDFYRHLIQNGELKTRAVVMFAKFPGTHKADYKGLKWIEFLKFFVKNFSFKDVVGSLRDGLSMYNSQLVRRLKSHEEEIQKEAQKFFDEITSELPFKSVHRMTQRTFEKLVYLGHNERELSVPEMDGVSDVRDLLGTETINCTDKVVWHGNTPVAVVTLTQPLGDEGHTYCGIMRNIELNPAFNFRMTTLYTVIPYTEAQAKKKITKNLTRVENKVAHDRNKNKEAKRDPKLEKTLQKLTQVRDEMGNPSSRLVAVRVNFLIYAPAVTRKENVQKALTLLDEQVNALISFLRKKPLSGDAVRETDVTLPNIYLDLLPGELSSELTGRELDGDTYNMVALAPIEDGWKGIGRGRNESWTLTNAGELVPFTVYRPDGTKSPVVIICAGTGGGKSFKKDKITRDFLSFYPNAKVIGADYRNNGRFAKLLGGSVIRFDPNEEAKRLILNSWYYPGIEKAVPPDTAQITMVTEEFAVLCGYNKDTTPRYKAKMGLIYDLVNKTYNRIVPKNQFESGIYHEPILRDFNQTLEFYPKEKAEPSTLEDLAEIKQIIKPYIKHLWLDAPMSEELKKEVPYMVYDLASLEKFPEAVGEVLAFRVTLAVLNADLKDKHQKVLKWFDEMHQYKNKFPSIMRAIEFLAVTERKTGGTLLLCGHHYTDFGKTIDSACMIIAGKQTNPIMKDNHGNLTDFGLLCKAMEFSDDQSQTLAKLKNVPGVFSSFMVKVKSDDSSNVSFIRVDSTPIDYWSFSNSQEDNAAFDDAVKIIGEYWTDEKILDYLAFKYPQGFRENQKLDPKDLIIERENIEKSLKEAKLILENVSLLETAGV